MNNLFERSIGLLGEYSFNKLQDKTILVAGIGGVGGTAYEALVRTGVKNIIIIDKDVVDASNINRQLLFTSNDIGKDKVFVGKEKGLAINPNASIIALKMKIDANSFKELNGYQIDFIIDCVDDIQAKVELVKFANEKEIPIVCSLGMANKLDPSQIKIATLNKTTVDPLAKKLRYELKQHNIDFANLKCVYSTESPIKDGAKLNSLMTVTSTAGLYLANYTISYFTEIK